MSNEALLMQDCGSLYFSIALESFGTTLLAIVFCYLLLLITNKGRLANPGRALWICVSSHVRQFVAGVSEDVAKWHDMPRLPLEARFAFCRKLNQAICAFQIVICVLTIERWLHINNVNGFRYLGYSITCPPMQVELVLLIAPKVPCFKLTCYLTYFVTAAMLWTGYAASMQGGELYTGSFSTFMTTWNMEDLQPQIKFWYLLPSIAAQAFLTFVQMPYMAFLYIIHGGVKGGLPHSYLKLLLIVVITWFAFPFWWALSYEGLSIIKDTKMNAIGFAVLNVCAKGSFTLSMLSMTRWHRQETKREEALAQGRIPRASINGSIFKQNTGLPEDEDLAEVERKSERTDTWIVRLLRPYDVSSNVSQTWTTMSPTYRAFLVGHGFTPKSFDEMSNEEKAIMHDKFESLYQCVDGDHQHVAKVAGLSVPPQAPSRGAPSKTAVAPSTPGWHMHSQFNNNPDPFEDSYADHSSGRQEIKVGQRVLTVSGEEGKVLKNMGDEVMLMMAGNSKQVVGKDELAKISITFVGARGMHNADWKGKLELMLFSSCMLTGKPSSEVRTPRVPPAARVSWKHESEIYCIKSGNDLTFSVYGFEPGTGDELLLGEGALETDMFHDDHFEGELQLFQNNKPIQTYLKVLVAGVGLPEHLAYDSMTRSVQPIVVEDSRQKGTWCCASGEVKRI